MKYIFSLILISIILPAFVLAQPTSELGTLRTNGETVGVSGATGSDYDSNSITKLIITIVNWFSWGIAVVAVVMGLYAAFLFITAGDDTAKVTQARDIIIWAAVGIVVAVLSFSIITITKTTLLQ